MAHETLLINKVSGQVYPKTISEEVGHNGGTLKAFLDDFGLSVDSDGYICQTI